MSSMGNSLFGERSILVVTTSFAGRLLAMLVRYFVFAFGFVAFALTSTIGMLSMLGMELSSVREVLGK